MAHPLTGILRGLATPQRTWLLTFSGANRAGTAGRMFYMTVAQGGAVQLNDPGFGALYGVAPICGWATALGSVSSPETKVYDLGETITPTADMILYPCYTETLWEHSKNAEPRSTSRTSFTPASHIVPDVPEGYVEPVVIARIFARMYSGNGCTGYWSIDGSNTYATTNHQGTKYTRTADIVSVPGDGIPSWFRVNKTTAAVQCTPIQEGVMIR